jgi:hypothetical protein
MSTPMSAHPVLGLSGFFVGIGAMIRPPLVSR